MTCKGTQEFLAQRKVAPAETVNAKKRPQGRRDALALLKGADHLYAARGKRVVHVALRDGPPPEAELLALMLGPTGNLRAPTLRRGKTLIVGFDDATYRRVFG